MRQTSWRLWLPGCIALICVSCTSLDPVLAPDLSIVNARFETVTFFETTAVFTIRLSNENPFSLTAEGGSFKVVLNGATTGRGLSDQEVDIPRLGSTTVEVPVHLNNLRFLLKLPEIRETGVIDYDLEGTLYLVRDGRSRRLQSRSSGEFVLPVTERDTLRRLAPAAEVP